MKAAPISLDGLRPLWAEGSAHGVRVAAVDVPFLPTNSGATIELVEWGAHDAVTRETSILPRDLEELVQSCCGSHPFSRRPLDAWGAVGDDAGRTAIAAACLEGARRRGSLLRQIWAEGDFELMVAVFSEVHRASHALWHTTESSATGRLTGPLIDIYRETDRQVGELIELVGPNTSVVVFSLHGMRPGVGTPTTLGPLLEACGYATIASTQPSIREKVLGGARRVAPSALKAAYHRLIPAARVAQLAGPPDPMPSYDWSRTTAFALPSDQHGWIRINLVGRERAGVVQRRDYERICAELKATLRGLQTVGGARLVDDVLQPGGSTPPDHLPDLVVHWADVGPGPIEVRAPRISAGWRGSNLSGAHAPHGFAIARSASGLLDDIGDRVEAEVLLPLLIQAAER
jgi:hypothetical protein